MSQELVVPNSQSINTEVKHLDMFEWRGRCANFGQRMIYLDDRKGCMKIPIEIMKDDNKLNGWHSYLKSEIKNGLL